MGPFDSLCSLYSGSNARTDEMHTKEKYVALDKSIWQKHTCFSTNQLCPVITSIEIYVRTSERSWRNVYAGPLQQHAPINIMLSNSIAKSRPPHLRKRLRIQREGESNYPLSLWPTSPSCFKLFCLFPISHWKTRHHLHLHLCF